MFVKNITFTKNCRRFIANDEIPFNNNLTILVGENGSGKSTILDILREHFKIEDYSYLKQSNLSKYATVTASEELPARVYYYDSHAENTKFSGVFGNDIFTQIQSMYTSSGLASLNHLLKKGITLDLKNSLIIMDEPCRGLSPFLQERIKTFLSYLSRQNQIIISTHSERIMGIKPATLYSVEHKQQYLSAEEFLTIHLDSSQKSQMLS